MQGLSLQSAMNAVSSRLDSLEIMQDDQHETQTVTELDAFLQLDPILADLYKQYLDSKAMRKDLIALNGANDPMVEVALDMEDSAWCAMQTRYLELRSDGSMMRTAQKLVQDCIADKKAEKKQKDRERDAAFMRMALCQARDEARAQETSPLLAWLVYWLWLSQSIIRQQGRLLSDFQPRAA